MKSWLMKMPYENQLEFILGKILIAHKWLGNNSLNFTITTSEDKELMEALDLGKEILTSGDKHKTAKMLWNYIIQPIVDMEYCNSEAECCCCHIHKPAAIAALSEQFLDINSIKAQANNVNFILNNKLNDLVSLISEFEDEDIKKSIKNIQNILNNEMKKIGELGEREMKNG